MTREFRSIIRVCHLNIEGISKAKCQYLHKILTENDNDVVTIQETHAENNKQLRSRGQITGYDIIGAKYRSHYGTAIYAGKI